jgi:hypothetical protein
MQRSPSSTRGTRLRDVFVWVNLGAPGVLVVGAYGALLEWKPAAYLLLAAVTVLVVANLGVGVVAYRGVMSRPWPAVRPLADDDDW